MYIDYDSVIRVQYCLEYFFKYLFNINMSIIHYHKNVIEYYYLFIITIDRIIVSSLTSGTKFKESIILPFLLTECQSNVHGLLILNLSEITIN